MKCNCYKLKNDKEFLIYGNDGFVVPEVWNCELIAEDINIIEDRYSKLPIIKIDSIYNIFKHNRDKILEEEGISSFSDLSNAYFLIKIKALSKSKRIRELVNEKYIEILDLIKHE